MHYNILAFLAYCWTALFQQGGMCAPQARAIHNEGSSLIMEESTVSSSNVSSLITEVSETELPVLPEALESPTKPVSTGFSIWLAAANAVLYICWVGIGITLLPLQVEQM